MPDRIPVKVAQVVAVTGSVRCFTLVAADGGSLPGFSSGSHIRVMLETPFRRLRNAYSLIGSPMVSDHYRIAVRKNPTGRGGSILLHERVTTGSVLEITPPVNLFPLVATARKHLFVAGGIGITPIASHLAALQFLAAGFELHFVVRGLGEAPFAAELRQRHPESVRIYDREAGDRFDIAGLLADQPLGTHLYVCGPGRLIEAATSTARQLGWPDRYVHSERFTQDSGGKPFTAMLRRSGREITVGPDISLLEALEQAGLAMPYQCRGGACGHCQTGLLEGTAEHRDFFLSDEIKRSHTRIMPCVSRAAGDRLVLDL
jgi:ferredoxin-NADP reductase